MPVPDWATYYADPFAIPNNCTNGGGVITPNRAPTITTFNPDFGAPRSWRANIGAQKRIGFANLTADFSYARGVRQTGSTDLNLDAAARFTLANEAGRPVYVPAAGIVPQTGAVDFLQSRKERQFGQVLTVDADLFSESYQLSLAGGGITAGGILYNASYTLAKALDQTSFGGGSTTSGDPNIRYWGVSDLDRRHIVVLTGTVPIGKSFEVTTVGRLTPRGRRTRRAWGTTSTGKGRGTTGPSSSVGRRRLTVRWRTE